MMQKIVRNTITVISILVLTSVILTGCGSSRHSVSNRRGGSAVSSSQKVEISASLAPQSRSLLKEVDGWLGTPYKYGGNDHNGIDCSALMLRVYNDALNIKLPRNSRAQSDYCTPIGRNELIPGDLVFFATTKGSSKVSHVGMYIGDGRMVHSSASRGVIVSDLSADYYTRTFAGAGRVEPYHAMIKKSGKRKDKPAKETAPVDAPPLPPADNPDALPFTLEPVASLPSKPEGKPRSQSTPTDQPAMTVPATVTASAAPEMSAELARRQVLDEIIEQKIDSIVAN